MNYNKKKELVLEGVSASKGVAEGVVRVLFPKDDMSSFNEGDVLVTSMTDPSMVLVMGMVSAIITDTGGITSHAAILSREMGVPCVVNTTSGTKELSDGDKVYIDGDTGKIYKILS